MKQLPDGIIAERVFQEVLRFQGYEALSTFSKTAKKGLVPATEFEDTKLKVDLWVNHNIGNGYNWFPIQLNAPQWEGKVTTQPVNLPKCRLWRKKLLCREMGVIFLLIPAQLFFTEWYQGRRSVPMICEIMDNTIRLESRKIKSLLTPEQAMNAEKSLSI